MPPKPTQSLEELQAQARRNFRYWPIYLMLRLREVEQHLSPMERERLGVLPGIDAGVENEEVPDLNISILLEYGLLAGDEQLPHVELPNPIQIPDAEAYHFRVGASLAMGKLNDLFQSLDFVAIAPKVTQHIEILRVPASEGQQLQAARIIFSEMQQELSAVIALEAARLWAALHGARLLNWNTLPKDVLSLFLPSETQLVTVLNPPSNLHLIPLRRKRGKGIFREPK